MYYIYIYIYICGGVEGGFSVLYSTENTADRSSPGTAEREGGPWRPMYANNAMEWRESKIIKRGKGFDYVLIQKTRNV